MSPVHGAFPRGRMHAVAGVGRGLWPRSRPAPSGSSLPPGPGPASSGPRPRGESEKPPGDSPPPYKGGANAAVALATRGPKARERACTHRAGGLAPARPWHLPTAPCGHAISPLPKKPHTCMLVACPKRAEPDERSHVGRLLAAADCDRNRVAASSHPACWTTGTAGANLPAQCTASLGRAVGMLLPRQVGVEACHPAAARICADASHASEEMW